MQVIRTNAACVWDHDRRVPSWACELAIGLGKLGALQTECAIASGMFQV